MEEETTKSSQIPDPKAAEIPQDYKTIQYHTHNGIDSPRISVSDLEGSFNFTPYMVTVANMEATTTETTVVSFAVQGNTVSDGDVIKIHVPVLFKFSDGGTNTLTIKLYWGSGSVTIYSGTVNSSAGVHGSLYEYTLQRKDSDLWVNTGNYSPQTAIFQSPESGNASSINSASFSSNSTVIITAKFGSSSSGYWKPGAARAYKIGT
jgi:hypothetical protein